ncbi:hypothetical protein V3391_06500 [Luteimonas sp. SMYT11W]|uniref:Phage tail protein n=1 Tax=Luteimonas flava TaxID=3115822 RepID=A0ABU7WDQ1_9GAMM
MARISRRNSALKFYLNGRAARDLHGLTDLAGNLLDAYDVSVIRARAGLFRRAEPAAKRNVRAIYNVRASALADRFRIEEGVRGKGRDSEELISIWASTRQLGLIEFGGRWRGPARRKNGRLVAGASAEIVRGKRKTYDSAFIATIKGREAIRVRSFDRARGRRFGRGPVRMLRGPSPFEMLSGVGHEPSRQVRDATLSDLTTYYFLELKRQFRLNRGA